MEKDDLVLLGPALDSFISEFAEIAITPTRRLISAYVRGQLGPLPRKSVMPMARDAGIAPRTLQELLSLHRWDEELLIDMVQRHVWRGRGGLGSVATILETCCPKKGTRTPGVDLQKCGVSGRMRNCVQLLHLGFSDGDFRCILDSALYLPKHWTDSPERREAARIPPAVRYRPKTQIALDLLDRASANGLRLGWVSLGIEYASDPQFLKDVESRGYRYVAPRTGLRDGADRSHGVGGPWISNGDSFEPAARAGEETRASFEQRSREIGLDHFEVRTYRSLLRHLALSAVSLLFLEERGRHPGVRRDRPALRSRAL